MWTCQPVNFRARLVWPPPPPLISIPDKAVWLTTNCYLPLCVNRIMICILTNISHPDWSHTCQCARVLKHAPQWLSLVCGSGGMHMYPCICALELQCFQRHGQLKAHHIVVWKLIDTHQQSACMKWQSNATVTIKLDFKDVLCGVWAVPASRCCSTWAARRTPRHGEDEGGREKSCVVGNYQQRHRNFGSSLHKLPADTASILTAAPLTPWMRPGKPWYRVHAGFATKEGQDFLVMVDAHSKWWEILLMSSTTAAATIAAFRDVFACFGFPVTVVNDNGPQFISAEFGEFLRRNGIKHTVIL